MVWCGVNKQNQMPFHPTSRTVPNCIASHYDLTAPFNSSHSSLVNPKFNCSSPCVVVIPPKNPTRLRFCTAEKAPLQLIANVYKILVASQHQQSNTRVKWIGWEGGKGADSPDNILLKFVILLHLAINTKRNRFDQGRYQRIEQRQGSLLFSLLLNRSERESRRRDGRRIREHRRMGICVDLRWCSF